MYLTVPRTRYCLVRRECHVVENVAGCLLTGHTFILPRVASGRFRVTGLGLVLAYLLPSRGSTRECDSETLGARFNALAWAAGPL